MVLRPSPQRFVKYQGGVGADLKGRFHIARDPEKLGWRVELFNRRPTYIITSGRRTGDGLVFAHAPSKAITSDCGTLATAFVTARCGSALESRVIAAIRRIVPNHVERSIRSPLANKAYVGLTNDEVMRGSFDVRS